MKVLHVYKAYPPVYGGIENHLRMLAVGLARDEVLDIEVLATAPGPRTMREDDEHVRVTRAGRQLEVARTPLSAQLCREVARRRPELTHLHVPYPFGELAYLLFGRGGRLVVTYHSDVVKQRRLIRLYGPILHQVLRRADRIIVTTQRYAVSSPHLAPFLDKCTVVPLGVEPARFRAVDASAVEAVKRAWPGPRVLFVGNFRYYKGLSYLVQAARWIRGRVLLVGAGPLEAEVRAEVKRLDLHESVMFAGAVSDEMLPTIYAAADVFVLPSTERSEAFGIVQLEAMASGLPVVSTELGTGTSYVNVHGETGFVVPPRDPKALADAIDRLLADPCLRARLGAAGRERVTREFTRQQMLQRTAALYRSLA